MRCPSNRPITLSCSRNLAPAGSSVRKKERMMSWKSEGAVGQPESSVRKKEHMMSWKSEGAVGQPESSVRKKRTYDESKVWGRCWPGFPSNKSVLQDGNLISHFCKNWQFSKQGHTLSDKRKSNTKIPIGVTYTIGKLRISSFDWRGVFIRLNVENWIYCILKILSKKNSSVPYKNHTLSWNLTKHRKEKF